MATSPELFGFVQFELPGALGIADGRFPVRDGTAEDEPERVLVVRTLGAPQRHLVRGRRPRDAEPDAGPEPVPVTRVTAIGVSALGDAAAAREWLRHTVSDDESRDREVDAALALLNRALHYHRAATADPHVHEASEERATTIRIGYGTGDEVADGRWSEATELSRRPPRRRRREALMPQERLAALLGARDQVNACETLLLRARLDLDQGREREAALQLRVGFEALMVELSDGRAGARQAEDMANLEAARTTVGEAANDALRGELGAEASRTVRETLEVCERVLRRRRILSG
jgi:hypothetical protein